MVARRSINRLVAPDAGPTLDTVARRTTCSRRQYERAQFAALSEAIGRERIDHFMVCASMQKSNMPPRGMVVGDDGKLGTG